MPSSYINPSLDRVLIELEAQRKKIANSRLQGWGSIALAAAIVVVASILNQPTAALIGAILFIPGIVILVRIGDDAKQYKNRFKREVVGTALSSINQSLKFDPDNGIHEEEFNTAQVFSRNPDRYFTEDLISGKSDKTSFYFAEVHAEYKTEVQTKSGRQTTWHDIFKGILFVADFNKHFNGVTIVRPKDIGNSIGAWFSKNIYAFGEKDVIELENQYFNKNFVVYGTDQVEARYLLTPAMMEKISELNERSAYCVSLSFIDSRLYIAFPLDQNYFEPPMFRTLLRSELLENDLSVLTFMHGIVAELDLNTRIWTKG